MQPSGSKTDLLLACQFPFGLDEVSSDGGPEAEYGSAFHELTAALPFDGPLPKQALVMSKAARVTKKWGIDDPTHKEHATHTQLAEHVLSSRTTFLKWLKSEIGPVPDEVLREASFVYNPWDGTTRKGEPPSQEGHIYPNVEPDELPMTLDVCLFLKKRGHLWIFDYKTGEPPRPDCGQLLSLGLTMSAWYSERGGMNKLHLGIVHAPRDGMTTVQVTEPPMEVLFQHRRALKRALARVGDGSLRPGAHCAGLYCPALKVCPSQRNALLELRHGASVRLSAERVGAIQQTMQLYDRHVESLRAELRAWVRKHGPGVRPDGQLVVLKPKSKRSLSLTSIEEALGHKEAERVIEILDKGGCIKTVEYEELRAEPDRGK